MILPRKLRLLITILSLSFLYGCHLTDNNSSGYFSDARYSHYYLKIRQMKHADLVLEIDAQKQFNKMGIKDAALKLILIHSLPNAPIHNPYTAKAKMNEYGLPKDSNWLLSNEDTAFFAMLRDQLNEQLLILQQLRELEEKQGYSKRKVIKQQNRIVTLEQNLQEVSEERIELTKKVGQLKQQITQLKLIEKSISQREQ